VAAGADDPQPGAGGADNFAYSVAVSGDVAVVGAPQDKPDDQPGAGSAYIFSLANAGDLDGDCDVDLDDYVIFYSCFTGPNLPADEGCLDADLSGDGDVDLEDFALFQNAFAAAP
jgi:hypothetical protein